MMPHPGRTTGPRFRAGPRRRPVREFQDRAAQWIDGPPGGLQDEALALPKPRRLL
jgi:hypothetical protein